MAASTQVIEMERLLDKLEPDQKTKVKEALRESQKAGVQMVDFKIRVPYATSPSRHSSRAWKD